MTMNMCVGSYKSEDSVPYPLMFKLLLLFIFFLPFKSVQIPIGVFGVDINFARIACFLFAIMFLINIAIDINFYGKVISSGKYRNPYVFWLLIYFLFSIVYYYTLVFLGKTILFGSGEESFLRNWQGRPFAQLISIITYGFVPFYLVKYYAQNEKIRERLERIFSGAIIILLFYAYLQIFSYIFFSFPITGRWITEFGRDLGAVHIFGIPFYRVNSLAGEPRDLGTLLVGAMPFYIYVHYGRMNYLTKLNVLLMFFAFLFTTSNSAFLAAGLSILVIVIDGIYQKRRLIRSKYLKYATLLTVLVFLMFRLPLLGEIGKRTTAMYDSIVAQLQTASWQPFAAEQASNLVIIYFVLNLPNVSPVYTFLGYGYSNFATPVGDLLLQHFNRRIEDVGIFTSDSFVVKLFIEGGLVGMFLYLLIFFYSLRLSRKLLSYFRARNDSRNYYKALWLRFAFIAFFVSGAIQMSFFYFIIMGLILGWLNEVYFSEGVDENYLL